MAIPSYTKTWLDLASTTIENYRPNFYDQVTDGVPLTKALRQHASVTLDGGDGIVEDLMYAHNSTVGSYSGFDVLDITPQQIFTVAKWDWADVHGAVSVSQNEIDRNRGKAQMLNLLQGRIKNLKLSFITRINEMLYADGSGNVGKDIHGLELLVSPFGTGTVGGINSGDESWWQNVAYAYGTVGSVTRTQAGVTNADTTFVYAHDLVFNQLTYGMTAPHMIFQTLAIWERMKRTMYEQKRFIMADTGEADPGFRHVRFNGVPCVPDRDMPEDSIASSTQTGRSVFLNFDFLNYYIHTDHQFNVTPFHTLLPKQNAFAMNMFLKAQLTTNQRRMQGILSGLHHIAGNLT